MHNIKVNEHSKTPKYKQIINSLITGIENKKLKVGDRLPSINKLLIKLDISRDTIVKAYEYLKEIDIIDSIPGKGYYIKNVDFEQNVKIFLLFNKLSSHKKIIYDAFAKTLGEDVLIDFFIYNNDFQLFKKTINANKDKNYTHFVIVPHFLEGEEHAADFINQIPKHKLILIDKKMEGIDGDFASVYQEFENDIYSALTDALPLLSNYKKLKLIFPPYSYHPKEILIGFQKFCDEFAFDRTIVSDIETESISSGEVYINLMEGDLVKLIKCVKQLGLKVRQDVGIISYNETPLKEILLDGITIISTDFEQLGKTAAELILSNKKEHIANPFKLIKRNSL